MNCSYHPAVESQGLCSACNKPLCPACLHQIKGKVFCQDCLVKGAEWVAAARDSSAPAASPRRAALCAVIPGMGAVYNGEYSKAVTFFAVFAALIVLKDHAHAIFGMAAFVFMIYTMFDAYRTAQARNLAALESAPASLPSTRDRTPVGWGIFLIVLGLFLLLRNLIPFYFLSRLWPLVFIGLGGYLVYRYIKNKD